MPTRRTLTRMIRTTVMEPTVVRLPDPALLTALKKFLPALLIILISYSLKFLMPNDITEDIVRQFFIEYTGPYIFQRTLSLKINGAPDPYPRPIYFLVSDP